MKSLVIYDSTGYIWNIIYGQEEIPGGLEKSAMIVNIPSNMRVLSIDVTDPNNPTPVFDNQPDTELGRLDTELQAVKATADSNSTSIENNSTSIGTNTSDITDIQVAIAELYESMNA